MIETGADIVLHSGTMYLGGHNDVLAGVLVAKDNNLAERLLYSHSTVAGGFDVMS